MSSSWFDVEAPNRKQVIKEGYLNKKGHVRHNWKTRWFKLLDNSLYYSRSTRDKSIKGKVNLLSATVVSPCLEYRKRDWVFRVLQLDGKEFLFQCGDERELSEWTVAISEVIRNLVQSESVSKMVAPSKPVAQTTLGSSITHRELVDAMQDNEAGLSLNSHVINGKTYKMCFSGACLIDWLLCWSFVKTREEGCQVGHELTTQAFIRPIESTTVREKEETLPFVDSQQSSYRFATILNSSSGEFEFVMSDSSSDSDDNTEEDGFVVPQDFGEIVKQGFLVKQGHIRRSWKVRKFVLRSHYAYLVYYQPTKENCSKGKISLAGAAVHEMEADETVQATCSRPRKMDMETCFSIRTRAGPLFVLQAPSQGDRNEWVQCISDVIAQTTENS